MEDMGFTYHPSTAGSSVRFDPPNPRDRAISFHKRTYFRLLAGYVLTEMSSSFSPPGSYHPPDEVEGLCEEAEGLLRVGRRRVLGGNSEEVRQLCRPCRAALRRFLKCKIPMLYVLRLNVATTSSSFYVYPSTLQADLVLSDRRVLS